MIYVLKCHILFSTNHLCIYEAEQRNQVRKVSDIERYGLKGNYEEYIIYLYIDKTIVFFTWGNRYVRTFSAINIYFKKEDIVRLYGLKVLMDDWIINNLKNPNFFGLI